MDPWKKRKIDIYRWATMPYRWFAKQWHCRKGTMPIGVLFYHRVDDEQPNPWTISNAAFEAQIDWMQRNFDLISMEEVQCRMRHGNSKRPALHITFDDGYADNCAQALPMLIERRIPVTYFVTTHHTTQQKPFPHDVARGIELPVNNIESLRMLSHSGIEIAAHTRTHPNLGEIHDEEKLFDEVIRASQELEKLVEQKIRYFAFPFGQLENLNPRVFQLLKENGFEAACSAHGGFNEIGDDPFYLRRFHGDPSITYLKNWLTLDPRKRKAPDYEWDLAKPNAKTDHAHSCATTSCKNRCKKSCDASTSQQESISLNSRS